MERREIEAYISLPEEGRVMLPGGVIERLTHAFSPSTDPGGLEGEVVDAFKFTVAGLVRERNRVVHALDEATDLIDDLLRRKEMR